MSAPNSPHIVSTPAQPWQVWDATSTAAVGQWMKLDEHGGPVSLATGRNTGEDFPSSGSWSQT